MFVREERQIRHPHHMDQSIINHLDSFLEDIPFPTTKEGLLLEALDSPVPDNVRDAIALLPDTEYTSHEELRRDLLGVPFDDSVPKKDDEDDTEEEVDDRMDSIVPLDDFTQMGDEEDHESV